jgi:hypothetical protein
MKKETIIKLSSYIFFVALVEFFLFLIFDFKISLGIFYGTIFSVINMLLLIEDIKRSVRRKVYSRKGYFLRYVLNIFCVGSAAFFGIYYFIGAAVGLFNLKIAILIFGRWLGEDEFNKGR